MTNMSRHWHAIKVGTEIPPNLAHAAQWEHGNASRFSSCFKHPTFKLQKTPESLRANDFTKSTRTDEQHKESALTDKTVRRL